MSAVARLAEDTVVNEITLDPSKWFFGGLAMVILVLLLVVVMQFNADR
ncbi:unannotated protein [freshwater metagenome]|jgi:hypothetical protein|uniref:Unannotated protein n=1 Tax=freshwater metagenome TaxID=449393 RepID=A0A6J7JH02_9ZZZZ|nr:hypothetical protein [Actinomycetota bacterium]MSW36720.1 hypothetical protein [Actinomycetota bacterium]MSX38168.1 hypothetical protein [Actinomycetota bacterium]